MNPLTALWIASLIGASLFFASGIVSAEVVLRLLGVKSKLAALPELASDIEERVAQEERARFAAYAANEERLKNHAAQAEALAQDHWREAEVLRQQLEIEVSTKSRLDQELSLTRARAEEASRKLTETQQSASLVPTLRKRLEEIERAQANRGRTVDNSDERVRLLERELQKARTDVERLETQLSARVDTQTASLESNVKRLSEQHQERNLRVKMLTDRVTELEAYAEENATLRGERDALKREIERLRRTTRDSVVSPPASAPRPQVDTAGMANITRPSQSGTTRRVVQESELTLESSLKQHISGLIAREPGLIAVLSDDNGFPVAGVGTDQEQEGVSVLTSLAQELALRANQFVDLERIERMELADGTGRALRVRFFDWESQPLALGCLGKRSLAQNPDEERVVAAFPTLLRRAWSA